MSKDKTTSDSSLNLSSELNLIDTDLIRPAKNLFLTKLIREVQVQLAGGRPLQWENFCYNWPFRAPGLRPRANFTNAAQLPFHEEGFAAQNQARA